MEGLLGNYLLSERFSRELLPNSTSSGSQSLGRQEETSQGYAEIIAGAVANARFPPASSPAPRQPERNTFELASDFRKRPKFSPPTGE